MNNQLNNKNNQFNCRIMLVLIIALTCIAGVAAASVPMTVDPQPSDERVVAESYAKNTALFKAKGSDLAFVTEDETHNGTAFTFTYKTKDNGFSSKTSYYSTPSLKARFTRTLIVTVKDGKVVAAVLDSKWDEINQKFLTTSRFTAMMRGTMSTHSASAQPHQTARAIAEAWLKDSPTYKADGFSLHFVEWKTDILNPNRYIILIDFKAKHPGFGNKRSYAASQVTAHRIELKVEGGKVVSAIIDEKWDEMLQKEHTTGKTRDIIVMRYQPKHCEKTPWMQWYTEEKSRFATMPSEDTLISTYYTTVYSYPITNVHKVMAEGATCNDCGCPAPYAFETQLRARDEARLRNHGWVRV